MRIEQFKNHIYRVISSGGKVLYQGSLHGCKNYIELNNSKYI